MKDYCIFHGKYPHDRMLREYCFTRQKGEGCPHLIDPRWLPLMDLRKVRLEEPVEEWWK